ncbi:hypothetical protein ABZP36_023067 [Zizania latifolia]
MAVMDEESGMAPIDVGAVGPILALGDKDAAAALRVVADPPTQYAPEVEALHREHDDLLAQNAELLHKAVAGETSTAGAAVMAENATQMVEEADR